MRALGIVAGLVAILTISLLGGVSGASRSGQQAIIVADVDGHPIKSALTSAYFCHDFDFPRIHCFRSAKSLKAAEAKTASVSPYFSTNDYVTIFDGPNYSGAFMDVSQNYDALFSIGWNDRISSFKARNGASGEFWTDWFASGTGLGFCCSSNISSLPSNLDNAFSSMYRR
jgi:hypothetical protein